MRTQILDIRMKGYRSFGGSLITKVESQASRAGRLVDMKSVLQMARGRELTSSKIPEFVWHRLAWSYH